MELWTNTALKTARACLRQFELLYELGYRPVGGEEEAPRFGSLMHVGLETWLMTWTLGFVLAAIDDSKPDAWDRAKARALLIGYCTRWKSDPATYQVLAVEEKFELEARHPHNGKAKPVALAGKIDGIVREGVRTLLVEHKTSSEDIRPGSDYWRRLRMDAQVSIYFDGARQLGHEVDGCLYDVIAKPSIRPLRATPPEARKYTKDGRLYANQRETEETPDEYEARLLEAIALEPERYYQRAIVVRLERELVAARLDVWQQARLLREPFRPRNPDACMRYGRACAFLPVCSGEANLADATRFRRVSNVHPEFGGDE